MFHNNCSSKIKPKKQIKDKNKLKQIQNWNDSDISKQIIKNRIKKVHFDTTTRFLDACIHFYKDEINNLLESGVDINCSDKDNLTALHQACINSKTDLVEFLLEKNADINVCDKEGWTPLHIAADIGSYELAKFLIDHGSLLDVANYDGDLPITFVNENEYPDLKIYFQKEMDKRNINAELCSNHERIVMLDDVRKWKSSGKYDPIIDSVNRSTPVHVASSKNYVEVLIELLPLLKYEDINAQDIDGWTPLHAAAHWGHREACTLLINNGADLDIRTRANESILDTVDPDLKDILSEEINKVKMENEKRKTNEIINEILLRPDTTNRRRSSIARQSVEWKKNTQMKDPASEREFLTKSKSSSDSSNIITIEECDERTSHHDSFKEEKKQENLNLKNEQQTDNFPLFSKSESYIQIGSENQDKHLISFQNEVESKNSLNKTLVSNGDHGKNSTPSPVDGKTQFINFDNRLVTIEIPEETCSDTEEFIQSQDVIVRLRPKSVRDQIISHRTTIEDDRLSLVMAPAKSEEAEVMRREKARRVRSMRRSTQAIDLGGCKEIEKIKPMEPGVMEGKYNSSIISDKTISISDINSKPSVNIEQNVNEIYETQDQKSRTDNQANDDNIERNRTGVSTQGEISKDYREVEKTKQAFVKMNVDNVDSSGGDKKKNPLKYQVSCPTTIQNPPISFDRARLNISNTLKNLIRKQSLDVPDEPPSARQISNENSTAGLGINVNKCLENSSYFDSSIIDSSKEKHNNNSIKNRDDVHSSQNTDNDKQRNSGSFVARPVFRNSSATKKSGLMNDNVIEPKIHPLSVQIESNDCKRMSTSSDGAADVNKLLKDDNLISKTVLTRMLNDQTSIHELQKQISGLKEEIKELKQKQHNTDSNVLVTITDKNNTDGVEKNQFIKKLEAESSKMREENKKLKSQNEALLRVISRIQQELENFRKLPVE